MLHMAPVELTGNVSLFTLANSVVLLLVAVLTLWARRDVRRVRNQVENNHTTNLREEADERHDANSGKLDKIIERLEAIEGSLRRLWKRSDDHDDAIDELTHPVDWERRPGSHARGRG